MNALVLSHTEAEKHLKSMKIPLRKLGQRYAYARHECLGEQQGPPNALPEDVTPLIRESVTVENYGTREYNNKR